VSARGLIGLTSLCLGVALISGCAGGAKSGRSDTVVGKLATHVVAASTVNPDHDGRASPVVVRIYQLRGASAFQKTDFFPLYEQEQATLGAELVRRDELTLRPAESRDLPLELDAETHFLGVAVAFRDIDQSQWRGLVEVGEKKAGLMSKLNPFAKKERVLNISIERLAVQAAFAEK